MFNQFYTFFAVWRDCFVCYRKRTPRRLHKIKRKTVFLRKTVFMYKFSNHIMPFMMLASRASHEQQRSLVRSGLWGVLTGDHVCLTVRFHLSAWASPLAPAGTHWVFQWSKAVKDICDNVQLQKTNSSHANPTKAVRMDNPNCFAGQVQEYPSWHWHVGFQ